MPGARDPASSSHGEPEQLGIDLGEPSREGKPAARELTSRTAAGPARAPSPTPASRTVVALPRPLHEGLALQLRVTDPEVIAELQRLPEGEARERFALSALRLGVLSLRMASGEVDVAGIQQAGERLVADMGGVLGQRASELTHELQSELRQYFDPNSGAFSQRIRSLLEQDGELERVLRAHLGPDESLLARTLAQHLGEGSAVFKMLSPTEAGGLQMQLTSALQEALAQQRQRLLDEFSLNNKESALSRLVGEIASGQGELQTDLRGQIEAAVKEFSLDEPNSALSRLVGRVDAAQRSISEQFSSDNEHSALSRMQRLLQDTSDQIGRNLTLDDDKSALARLKRELEGTIAELVQKNLSFHGEVRETLAQLQATKKEAARSTRHGLTFETQVGDFLSNEAQRFADVYQAVGNSTGLIKNCKRGDHVIELGPDSAASGARVVFEAKQDKSYDLRAALGELEDARKNRDAQIGVFVFSRVSAPEGQQPFARYGEDLVVVWDAEDAGSDVFLQAAYSVARALALRVSRESGHAQEAVLEVQLATRSIEKQLQHLDQLKTWGDTVKKSGENISDRAERMRKDLAREIERLDAQLDVLKAPTEG